MILLLTCFALLSWTWAGPPNSAMKSVKGLHCDRPCDGAAYQCVFNWKIITHRVVCEENPDECFGDGQERLTTLVLDEDYPVIAMPALGINVCHGDEVVVNIENDLSMRGLTMHWHGLQMRNTQWSDGVPLVTQCEVQPGETFTHHKFIAEQTGTYWFHSHVDFQRDDGMYGPLIVRDLQEDIEMLPLELQDLLQDSCDLTEHTIMLEEWYLNGAEYRALNNMGEKPTSLLVNGKGRVDPESTMIDLPVFNINPEVCTKYRFRLISAVGLHCPIVFSIEDHDFKVIASDGGYVRPLEVSSLTISNGERFDIIIDTAGHDPLTYKMRFSGSNYWIAQCNEKSGLAFLQYGDSPVDQSTLPDYEEALNIPGKHLNPLPNIIMPSNQEIIPIKDMKSIYPIEDTQAADKTFYIELGRNAFGANLNNIRFDFANIKTPLLLQDSLDYEHVCDPAYAHGEMCDPLVDPHACVCAFLLEVNKDDVVEIFFTNPTGKYAIAHPTHLHGYDHAVIGSGVIPEDAENLNEWVKTENEAGNIPRNFVDPPQKDSVQSIPGSYLLVRFTADNPGYWIWHCHISFDAYQGQALVFKVGDREDWDIPEDFPTC